MANMRSVAMLMAIKVLVSNYDNSMSDARKCLTAVEDTNFPEDVRAITCSSTEGRSQLQVVASSDWLTLQYNREYRADGEHDQEH